jgi:hypothetical protein
MTIVYRVAVLKKDGNWDKPKVFTVIGKNEQDCISQYNDMIYNLLSDDVVYVSLISKQNHLEVAGGYAIMTHGMVH